jgi:hypothetical protein
MPASVANAKTIAGYKAKAKRIMRRVQTQGGVENGIDRIIAEAIGTREHSRSSVCT